MHRSQQVLEWQREAQIKTQRKLVLQAFHILFGGVPEEVKAAVTAMTDQGELSHWFRLAVAADSLAAFLAAVQPPPMDGPTS
jgi:hypothetical protein